MNKIKNNKKALIISLIIIIATLIVLSTVVKALVSLKEINTTGELAEFAAKNPQGFIYDATPGQIFAINASNNKKGMSVAGGDVYYRSTICLFHTQATVSDGTKVFLTNVVDIEAPGDVVVYRYKSIESVSSGKVGTITEKGSTITEIVSRNENGSDKKYKVTYTKTVLNLSDAEREDFEKMAFLMDKAMDYDIDVSDKVQSSYTEAMIDWLWKDRVKDYIAKRGVLDPYFDVDTYPAKDRPSYIQSEAKAAEKAAAQIKEVELTKGDTKPEVYYGDNGKAYIGPLQVTYSGGKTSIIVEGKSGDVKANWVTKTGENTFSKEETGNITSGQVFYAVVDASEIEDIENVKVRVELTYTKGYKARFALANNKTQGGQNIMFFAGNKDSQEGADKEEWTVENIRPKYGDLIIHKKGDNNISLEGVEFTIWKAQSETLGYLRLSKNSQFVAKIDQEIDINDYEVEYVGINDIDKATKFVTNSDGKIIIRNLEYARGRVYYSYYAGEEVNNHYGYKGMSITIDDVDIQGGTVEQVEADGDIEFVIGEEYTEILLTVQNNPELVPLEIVKVGEDGKTTLPGVKFKVEIGNGLYLQLQDASGPVKSVTGTVTINKNNIVNETEYAIKYIEDKDAATEFVTDENGKIVINNLEINASRTEKYTYTAHETFNPNFGYGSGDNATLTGTITELKLNETNTITIKNKQDLGNLILEKKHDSVNTNIVLPNVGFIVEISTSENEKAYLKLKDANGNSVDSIVGTATISSKNVATEEEYSVEYDTNKDNATEFITDENGNLRINNLEVYEKGTGSKYTYRLIEVSNDNYGYDIIVDGENISVGGIQLNSGEDTIVTLANPQKYIKISGYVWVENSGGKSNQYDCVYTEGEDSVDVKLKDLYNTDGNGNVTLNPQAEVPVEIKLRDKTTGEFVRTKPDEFDNKTGEYTFTDIEIEKLENYEVVFVYNGFYYVTVTENLEQDNGSKVKEIPSERTNLNNKFATVKDNSEVVSTDGTVNKVEYNKEGHISTLSKLNFDTSITANTSEAKYYLDQRFNAIKTQEDRTTPIEGLDNVNMGIVLREQPKISINSDIYSVLVEFEGYNYNYKYNGRQNYYEDKNGDGLGVKFEQEYTEQRYTRTVYASDVQAAQDPNKEMKVEVTYKLQMANESRTLRVMPKQIINYYDARYTVKAVGVSYDEGTHTTTQSLNFSQAQGVNGHPEYKSTIIDFGEQIEATNSGTENKSNVKQIYITFSLDESAITDLLHQKSTFHNASEVLSYTTYYAENTSKIDGITFMTDNTQAGNIYAGIDKMSQPGNMEIKLIPHSSGEGTEVLDTTYYEDDTTSAPSLVLEVTEARIISGTIFEDQVVNTTNKQKLGNGIFESGEKTVDGVAVSLHTISETGMIDESPAKYSNGTNAIATTDGKGNYVFGEYVKNADGTTTCYGVLPGKYVIKYTYGEDSYIVVSEEGGTINKKFIDPNEYKSTIIPSEAAAKKGFEEANTKWHVIFENIRYTDARDDITLRAEHNPSVDENLAVTYSSYTQKLRLSSMNAYTPIMDIGIEFTETNEADALTTNFEEELENVDFGIIERPDIDITVNKDITSLEILSQTGTSIIPKGNPSDVNTRMQYVKTGLDGMVSAEVESGILQGAKLNIEYTITVINNSDRDYREAEYYYYGTGGVTETTPRAKTVVDYLDTTMSLDPEQESLNQSNWEITKTAEDLYNSGNGFISEAAYNALTTGNYHIFITNAFENVETGNQGEVKLYTTRYLAVTDAITEANRVEIIEVSGKRAIKESIPGNHVPSETEPPGYVPEPDEDRVDLVITPPTGTTVNYVAYIIATLSTLVILVLGIVIIKKKIIK